MEDNLRAWLEPRAKRIGPIYDFESEDVFEKAVVAMHRAIEAALPGFKWKEIALRHSYGSYLYGCTRNGAFVKACMGNTEEMMMTYYNSPKTREEEST